MVPASSIYSCAGPGKIVDVFICISVLFAQLPGEVEPFDLLKKANIKT